jgi:copper transport protein
LKLLLGVGWVRGGAFLLALLAAAAHPTRAKAHASLIRSEPVDRAVVAQPPATLKLTFNEPASPLVLRLVGPTGEATALKDIITAGNAIIATLPTVLPQGTHLVSWRVISLDGHPVGGALTFSVGAPSATPAAEPQVEADRSLRLAIWLTKIVLYVGLFFGIGGAFYAAWIAIGPLAARTRKLIAAALECGLAAAIISVGLQGLDVLGLPLSQLRETHAWTAGLATSYGWTVGIALAGLVAARIALDTQSKRLLSSLALVGVGAALAASGHAAVAEPQLLTRPAVLAHGVAIAFWIGALLPLVETMHSAERQTAELMRFSRAVPAAVIVLIASGATLAVVQLRQFDALWTTYYGLILCAKLAAVLALIALAAVNRYALTPRIVARDGIAARRLVRSISVELLLVVVVLGLVATWRFTPPPRSLIAAAEAPVHIHIHSDKAMADLTIESAGVAGRRIAVTVLDGQFGPLPAKEVTLLLAKPEAGIEPLRMPATQVEGASWRIDHVQLPALGNWHVRVEILVSDFEKITLEDKIALSR